MWNRMLALCDAVEDASLRIEGFLFRCTGNRAVCLGGFGEYRVKPWLASVREMTTVFATPDELLVSVGTDLGSSEWVTIEQARIDGFADATGDHQWIHIDPAAAAAGPFGATIAHGYLPLALTNQFLPEIVRVDGVSMGINYGVNRVRFPQPVTVGSRVRGHATLTSAEEIGGGVQAVITITVEIEGGAKPACVVESVSRFLR